MLEGAVEMIAEGTVDVGILLYFLYYAKKGLPDRFVYTLLVCLLLYVHTPHHEHMKNVREVQKVPTP